MFVCAPQEFQLFRVRDRSLLYSLTRMTYASTVPAMKMDESVARECMCVCVCVCVSVGIGMGECDM